MKMQNDDYYDSDSELLSDISLSSEDISNIYDVMRTNRMNNSAYLEELLEFRNHFDVEFNQRVLVKSDVLYSITPSYFINDVKGETIEVNPVVEMYLDKTRDLYLLVSTKMDESLQSIDWVIKKELECPNHSKKRDESNRLEVKTKYSIALIYQVLKKLKKYAFERLDFFDKEQSDFMINN